MLFRKSVGLEKKLLVDGGAEVWTLDEINLPRENVV